MAESRTRNATKNIFCAILLQSVIFLRGMILPRLLIPTYGSDINGLFSSITQFLTYISLLDAGIGTLFRTALYKPLANGDYRKVSGMINEQRRFYRNLSVVFILYVAALCIFYPRLAKTDADPSYTVSCILILSVGTFAEYLIAMPYVSLLSADQKIRIQYLISVTYVLFNIALAAVLVPLNANLRLIYLTMSLLGLLRPLIYRHYVKKHYPLDPNAPPDRTLQSRRRDGIIHHITYFVHRNTDTALLTLLLSTATVSVYNIYGAIVFGIRELIQSVTNGIAAGIGNLIALGDRERLNKTFETYELVQSAGTTVLYSVTTIMLIPFVKLYTSSMTDAEYVQPAFGYLMIVAEAIYCFRCIYGTVSTAAGKFRETRFGAIAECVINLTVSLFSVTVMKSGLVGVAIGTALGMGFRYLYEVRFLSEHVLHRPKKKAFKMLGVSVLTAGSSIGICRFLPHIADIATVGEWIFHAVTVTLITSVVTCVWFTLFCKDAVRDLKNRIVSQRKRNLG